MTCKWKPWPIAIWPTHRFEEARELVEMQLEISPQNELLNRLLYGIYGETKDIDAYFDTTLKRFEASKSLYNVETMADATLVSGEYDRYLEMVNLYVKLNPGNNFIFPFALVPQILKGDLEAASKTLKKTKLVHSNKNNINEAFDEPIAYLKENKVGDKDLEFFEGLYRSQQSEATIKFWVVDDRLLSYYSNQNIQIAIPAGKDKLVYGNPNQYTSTFQFFSDENGSPYCAKVDEHYQNVTIPYWIWKVDDTILRAQELLQKGDYGTAETAYRKAIAANPEHYYLKDALQHIEYVKEKDSLELIAQYQKVVGTYSKEGVENTRRLFIKDGNLMYKRSGLPSKQLYPISETRYLNPSSLRLHFEFEFEEDEAVASFSWLYDPEKREWENYGAELNYLFKQK